MSPELAAKTVNEIFELYERYGASDYIGEAVSQIEHMCQSAQLAEAEGEDDEMILAAFFHDIGHLCEHIIPAVSMNGYGVQDHEHIAGQFLRQKGFSEKIALLVENHVEAKRYLTYKHPEYFRKLSDASRMTLEKQGGVMQKSEAEKFEADFLHLSYIKLREWDDKAKLVNVPLPPLQRYRDMALAHLLHQN